MIVQDDLQNTYQRLPRKESDKRETHEVDVTGTTRTTGSNLDGTIADSGTITGRPFGPGTIEIVVNLAAGNRASGTFDIGTDNGTAFGTVEMDYLIDLGKGTIHFTGTASFSGGTGKYRGIKGNDLAATDDNTLDGQNGRLTLTGDVRY